MASSSQILTRLRIWTHQTRWRATSLLRLPRLFRRTIHLRPNLSTPGVRILGVCSWYGDSSSGYCSAVSWVEFWVIMLSCPTRGHSRGHARYQPVSYTHLRAHETVLDLVCR